MALGTVTDGGSYEAIELLASADAANSEPSGGNVGIAINDLEKPWPEFFGVLVGSAAGSGTMTATLRLWGYNPTVRAGCAGHTGWLPVGPGTGTTAGQLNGGIAITEVQADKLAHSEAIHIASAQHFTRLYLEIEAIGGTSTAIVAWLVWGKR